MSVNSPPLRLIMSLSEVFMAIFSTTNVGKYLYSVTKQVQTHLASFSWDYSDPALQAAETPSSSLHALTVVSQFTEVG